MENRGCIALFVKSPEKGRVKTRLAMDLGEDAALGLYRCFVSDTLDTLTTGSRPVKIAFHPPEGERMIMNWLGDYPSMPQRGDDLGERMMNTFLCLFSEGYSPVVIMGSDIPDLPLHIIEEAFESFREHDAVIGPACDGGYYLVGMKRETFCPDIFRGIPWSTGEVLAKTMTVFQEKGCRVHSLPEWGDLDTADDLMALWERAKTEGFMDSRTISLMMARGIVSGEV